MEDSDGAVSQKTRLGSSTVWFCLRPVFEIKVKTMFQGQELSPSWEKADAGDMYCVGPC